MILPVRSRLARTQAVKRKHLTPHWLLRRRQKVNTGAWRLRTWLART